MTTENRGFPEGRYLRGEVRADPHDTSLDGHLEGEADDPANFQQRRLAKAPSSLTTEQR